MTSQERYADKIAKLLAKAESTTSEEAELLIAKAQELMAQYSIEEFMVEAARGKETDIIEQCELTFQGSYRKEFLELAWRICLVNNCKGVQWERTLYDAEFKTPGLIDTDKRRQRYPKELVLEVTGFASDLRRVELLNSSLHLQAISAVTSWWKEHKENWQHHTYAVQTNVRKDFLDGFTSAVNGKLHKAYSAGKDEAIKTESERQHMSTEAMSDSVALVLRSRKERVEEWYDNHYGNLRSSRARGRSSSSYNAREDGRSAGLRADVGQGAFRGTRKGLNR